MPPAMPWITHVLDTRLTLHGYEYIHLPRPRPKFDWSKRVDIRWVLGVGHMNSHLKLNFEIKHTLPC